MLIFTKIIKMGSPGSKLSVPINKSIEIALENVSENANIVSVGSGFGETEYELEELFNVNITTIDPLRVQLIDPVLEYENVNGFNKPKKLDKCKTPMFENIDEYIHKRENKMSDLLILDWPSPNEAIYGIDAIVKLLPTVIVIRYASCGAAGSNELQSFLYSCGCPASHSLTSVDYNVVYGEYKCIYSDQTVIGTGGDFDGKTIDVVVLLKK
jgi:hypothetical protein